MKKRAANAKPAAASSGLHKLTQITGILLMTAGGILLASLFSHTPGSAYDPDIGATYPPDDPDNWAGRIGALIAWRLLFLVGYGAYPLALIVLACGWCVFRGADLRNWVFKTVAALFLVALYCGVSEVAWDRPDPTAFRYGGAVGMRLALELLRPNLGLVGSYLACGALAAVTLILVTNIRFDALPDAAAGAAVRVGEGAAGLWARRRKAEGGRRKTKTFTAESAEDAEEDRRQGSEESLPHASRLTPDAEADTPERPSVRLPKKPPRIEAAEDDEAVEKVLRDAPLSAGAAYAAPAIDLLTDPPEGGNGVNREALVTSARKLESSLVSFGIEGKVLRVTPGPVITSFEVEPPPGVKVNRIVSLSDDLALAMKARSIRIQAPIPGKSAVGIEIPNAEPSFVYLKEIVGGAEFQKSPSRLLLALGKTVFGDPCCADLGKMPHLLIAGATGAGKSICINVLISSLLFRAMPDEVRLIMIDPKMLELSVYNDIPHLLAPVVTDPKKASEALRWAVGEMESRYQRLARVGVRNIGDFNLRVKGLLVRGKKDENGETPRPLPYIVVIIDELADLMMTAPADIEDSLCRLAQMARAVGIHLVVATQRPSVDVITGVIKANFPARIAFQVASKIDSRTILDAGGAERLLGRGDMLYLPAGQPEPVRIHGAYISTEETERIVAAIQAQGAPSSSVELTPRVEETAFDERERDPLYEEALRLVITHQQASASLLQRRLKVGYSRAGRLIDELEMTGIIGPFDGSKARQVLVDEAYLGEMYGRVEEK
jgi:S-DNA-T family DNA segregation ATPase FtsK/SpoIIIE